MKTIVLMRHGKAKKDEGSGDVARKLTKTGLEMSTQIARSLKADGLLFDAVLSSPVVRAMETARAVVCELGMDPQSIRPAESLYSEPSVESFMGQIDRLSDDVATVLVVGHNPHLSDVAAALVPGFGADLPCCGLCAVRFDVSRWADVAPGRGRLEMYRFSRKTVESEEILKTARKGLERRLGAAITGTLASIDGSAVKGLHKEISASARLIARAYVERAPIITLRDPDEIA